MICYDTVRYDTVQNGVCFGIVRCGMLLFDTVGVVWYGVVWPCMIWSGMVSGVWYGMWGMVCYNVRWYGMAWNGICYSSLTQLSHVYDQIPQCHHAVRSSITSCSNITS